MGTVQNDDRRKRTRARRLRDCRSHHAEVRHGIHAGAVETAMMLAVRPDLVRTDLALDFAPATLEDEREFPRLRALGAAGFGWQAQDIHPEGAAGDARQATAAVGEQILTFAAEHLRDLLLELVRYPLERLRERQL